MVTTLGVLVLSLVPFGLADDPKAPSLGATRSAFERLQASQARVKAAGLRLVRARDDEAVVQAHEKAKRERDVHRRAFHDAFLASDWAAWSPTSDAALLGEGLNLVATTAVAAGDAALVARADAMLLRVVPGATEAAWARLRLPQALVALGRAPEAIDRLRELAEGLTNAAEKGALELLLGDIQCVTGDLEGARATYAATASALQAAASSGDKQLRMSSLRTQGQVDLRLALIGSVAPELDSEIWYGDRPASGRATVLHFFATYSPPSRDQMRELEELWRSRQQTGLAIIGLTRYDRHGHLPADANGEGAANLRTLDDSQFRDHLHTYRQRAAITYPWVVVDRADFDRHHVAAVPTTLILDPARRIQFIDLAQSRPWLRSAVITRLLKPASQD